MYKSRELAVGFIGIEPTSAHLYSTVPVDLLALFLDCGN